MRGRLWLLLGLAACACGQNAPNESQYVNKRKVVKAPDIEKRDTDGPASVKSPPLRLGGERVKIADVASPLAGLPKVDFAPVLEAKPSKAEIEARYALATKYVADGDDNKALALLHQLFTLEDCRDCVDLVIRVVKDPDWKRLYSSHILHLVIDAWVPPSFECPTGPKDSCPAGTKRKGDDHSAFQGESWCEKPGGIKHGPSRTWETDSDDGGHEMHQTTEGCFFDGKENGNWRYSDNWDESNDYSVDGLDVGVHQQEHSSSSYTELHLSFAGKVAVYWHQHKEHEVEVERGQHVDSKLHGEQLTWTIDNGYRILTSRKHYRNGVQEGPQVQYSYTTGQAVSLVTYADSELHGRVEYWDKSGKPLASTEMIRGNGSWIRYTEDGVLVEKGTYADGKKQGLWTDPNGKDGGGTGHYKAGVRAGKWTLGTAVAKSAEGEYKAGKRHGVWTYYDDNQDVRARGALRNGLPDGTWKVSDMTFQFRRGKLLNIDGEKFHAKEFDYHPESFASDPGYPEERIEEDYDH